MNSKKNSKNSNKTGTEAIQKLSPLSIAILSTGLSFIASPVSLTWASNLDEFQASKVNSKALNALSQDPGIKSLLNDSATHRLGVSQRIAGSGSITTKFRHFYKGIEVMGSMAYYRQNQDGTNAEVDNRIALFDLNTNPSVDMDAAVAIARSVTPGAQNRKFTRMPELKVLPDSEGNSARLVYILNLSPIGFDGGREVMLNAHTGEIIANNSLAESIAPVEVHSARNTGLTLTPVFDKTQLDADGNPAITGCYLSNLGDPAPAPAAPGAPAPTPLSMDQCNASFSQACQVFLGGDTGDSTSPVMVTPQNCLLSVQDSKALAAADDAANRANANSQLVLNYYQNTFGRNSYDNQGATLVSVVHVGQSMVNAFWMVGQTDPDTNQVIGNFMSYGDGDASEGIGDMTLAIDVAGHEMTHGVTSQTAKLSMSGDPGALNEANSDFFGKMIENQNNWILGQQLYLDPANAPGFRRLDNPSLIIDKDIADDNGNQVSVAYPNQYSDLYAVKSGQCTDDNDHCWIHHNSTIYSHGLYLISQAISKEKAQQIQYLALTQYWNDQTSFKTATQLTYSACQRLQSQGTVTQSDCDAVNTAFTQIGLPPTAAAASAKPTHVAHR